MVNLSRLFSAIATPLRTDGGLGREEARLLASHHVSVGVEGIYVAGSSGEGLLLEVGERMEMLDAVIEGVDGRVPVVAHIGSVSTRDSLALARHAREAGAVAVSMIPPIYYRYSQAQVLGHYREVMDSVDLPMIVYNIPQFTGQEFGPDHELLQDERVIGVKFTAHSMYSLERMAVARPGLQIINGFDEAFLPALVSGATGSIGTTVSFQIDAFKAVRASIVQGDLELARTFQARINETIQQLVAVDVFPAAKWVEERISGIRLGPCRMPFSQVPKAAVPLLEKLVERIRATNEEARNHLGGVPPQG